MTGQKKAMAPPSADISAPSVPKPFERRGNFVKGGPPKKKEYGERQPTYAEKARKRLAQDTAKFRRSVMQMKTPDKYDEDADKLFVQKPQRSVPLADLRRVLEPTASLSKTTPLPLTSPKLDILSSNVKYQLDMERLRALPVTSGELTVTQRAFHVMTRNPTITIEKKRRSLERIAKLVGEKVSPQSKQIAA